MERFVFPNTRPPRSKGTSKVSLLSRSSLEEELLTDLILMEGLRFLLARLLFFSTPAFYNGA